MPLDSTWRQYQPLAPAHIRVLCLHPGAADALLAASLEHVNLNAGELSAHYEAISYAWGERIFEHDLQLDGYGCLRITKSLNSALREFRWTNGTARRLWTDAICIDQTNPDERAAQVQMMARIFGTASSVLVWLGPSCPQDALAFATIANTPDRNLANHDSSLKSLASGLSEFGHCKCCREPFAVTTEALTLGLAAVARLLDRAWFSRLWVVQEVMNYRGNIVQVCAGTHRVQWSEFFNALSLINYGVNTADPGRTFADTLPWQGQVSRFYAAFSDMRQREFSTDRVLQILAHNSVRLCSDPRDRIFAVRPLLGVSKIASLNPDYNLPTPEVFRRLVCACLLAEDVVSSWRHRPYTFLAFVGTEEGGPLSDEKASWPTWVPDLHRMSSRSRQKIRVYDRSPTSKHDRVHRYEPQFRSESELFAARRTSVPEEIKICAYVAGTVVEIWTDLEWPKDVAASHYDSEKQACTLLVEWYLLCRERLADFAWSHYRDYELTVFLMRGFVDDNDILAERFSPAMESLIEEHFETSSHGIAATELLACKEALSFLLSLFLRRPSIHLDFADQVVDRGQMISRVRVGERWVLAWMPKSTRLGDQLCLVRGTPYPLVVRPASDSRYTLVGDAYTTALSVGEVFGQAVGEGAGCTHRAPFGEWSAESEPVRGLVGNMGWITLC